VRRKPFADRRGGDSNDQCAEEEEDEFDHM
jgi:hypothetical protein